MLHTDMVDLIKKVKKLKKKLTEKYGNNCKNCEEYKTNDLVKKLSLIRKLIKEEIPSMCYDPKYYATPPLSMEFRRAKMGERYRLFFQYSTVSYEIVYLWFNNEATLRSRGSKTDCYNIFLNMVSKGVIHRNYKSNKYIKYKEPFEEFLNDNQDSQ